MHRDTVARGWHSLARSGRLYARILRVCWRSRLGITAWKLLYLTAFPERGTHGGRESMPRCVRLLSATLVLIAAASPSWSGRAYACAPGRCTAATVLPASGSVPANAVEFLFQPERDLVSNDGGVATPRLVQLSADGDVARELPFDIEWQSPSLARIRPKEVLPPGTTLALDHQETCISGTPRTVRSAVSVTESARRPTSLGTLRVVNQRGPMAVWVNSGECVKLFDASIAELTVELATDTKPYADSLRFGLRVNGSSELSSYGWQLNTWTSQGLFTGRTVARGSDLLFTLCEASPYGPPELEPRTQRVRMVALLPDGTELSTDEVTVELTCAQERDAGSVADGGSVDAGRSGMDAAAAVRAFKPDAFVSDRRDAASTAHDAGSELESEPPPPSYERPTAGEPPEDDEGCSVATGSKSAPAPIPMVFGALLALALAARRRVRR